MRFARESVLAIALVAASAVVAIAALPTPVPLVGNAQIPFAAGNVAGLVGYAGNEGNNCTAGNGSVWAHFGHQVSGAQCPSATDNQQQPNDMSLTFTRSATNNRPYKITSTTRLTEKVTHRRSTDNNCLPGPPTWAPASDINITGTRISFPGTQNPPVGDIPPTPGAGGSFQPPTFAHSPMFYGTNIDGNSAQVTSFNTDMFGNQFPNPPQPMPPAYQDSPPATGSSSDWYSDQYHPPGDTHASVRSHTATVSTTVTAHLQGTAVEIIVPYDNSDAKATLTATVQFK